MEYDLLKLAHVLGAVLIGAGLIGVWVSDLRSRELAELRPFAEAVRNIAVFYDGLVVPGALLLLVSGGWMTAKYYGGWAFIHTPWLAGMISLFAFEFIEGNTITRLYFMRLRRLAKEALEQGHITPALAAARRESIPTFTHFLDLPVLFLIIVLGVIKPSSWALFGAGSLLALLIAGFLTIAIPWLYPWSMIAKPDIPAR